MLETDVGRAIEYLGNIPEEVVGWLLLWSLSGYREPRPQPAHVSLLCLPLTKVLSQGELRLKLDANPTPMVHPWKPVATVWLVGRCFQLHAGIGWPTFQLQGSG